MSRGLSLLAGAQPPGRAEWLEARRQGLGSSDAAAICGLNPYKTAFQVYLEKVYPPEAEDSLPARLGRITEEAVARVYSEETGRPVRPPAQPILQHPTQPWMLASLDRVTEVDGRPRALEVKTVWGGEASDWGEPGTDEVPDHVVLQVQHQLAVTGWDMADVVVLFRGRELSIYEVPRSESIIGKLQKILSDFWSLHVERREPPPLDYSHPDAISLVKRLYPGVDDRVVVDLDEHVQSRVSTYRAVQETLREIERKRDALKAELLSYMGEAHSARLPNGTTLSRTVVTRKGYTVEPCTYVDFRVRSPKRTPTSGEEGVA